MSAPSNPPFVSAEAWKFTQSIELSVRAANVVAALDVKNLDEFMALTKDRIMATKNAGIRTWNEIAAVQDYFRTEANGGRLIERAKEAAVLLNDIMNQLPDRYHLEIDPLNCVQIYERLTP